MVGHGHGRGRTQLEAGRLMYILLMLLGDLFAFTVLVATLVVRGLVVVLRLLVRLVS